MALIQCKECKAQISDSAKACPACGAPQPKGMGIFAKLMIGVAAILALFLVVGAIGSANESPEKKTARRAYELCKDDLAAADRARNGTSSTLAGYCETMRSDFLRKYGNTP